MSFEMAVLAATFAMALTVTPVLTFILARQREKALETMTAFAQAGLEVPAEVRRIAASPLAWGGK